MVLRNSLIRKSHKERAQPLHRQRLGLLEKHKDYVLRARDYKSKQDRIRKLREKAAFRNKDEFYWGMVKGKTKEGVAVADRGNEALSVDVVKLLKSQDVGYIRVQIAKDEKQISKLRAELETSSPGAGPSSEWDAAAELAEVEKLAEMGIVINPTAAASSSRKGKGKARAPVTPTGHVIFVDGQEDFNSRKSTAAIYEEQAGEEEEEAMDLGWDTPEPKKPARRKTPAEQPPADEDEVSEDDARAHRLEQLTKLSALLSRVRLLRQAESRLETTKALMGKGAVRKVREAGWVEDETQKEDRNGERRRFESKMWKWKLERKK